VVVLPLPSLRQSYCCCWRAANVCVAASAVPRPLGCRAGERRAADCSASRCRRAAYCACAAALAAAVSAAEQAPARPEASRSYYKLNSGVVKRVNELGGLHFVWLGVGRVCVWG